MLAHKREIYLYGRTSEIFRSGTISVRVISACYLHVHRVNIKQLAIHMNLKDKAINSQKAENESLFSILLSMKL